MTDDAFTMLCITAIVFSVTGLAAIVGYSWGFHLGAMHENKRVPRGTAVP